MSNTVMILCLSVLLVARVINAQAIAFSAQDISDVLYWHNLYRKDVQPPAATALSQLTWDANLATVSYNWAAKCTQNSQGFLDHNPNRSAEYGQTVGENIYAGSAASINTPYLASKNWNDENTTYTLSTNTCTGVCGHYTQIVWANTQKIGCAKATCNTFPTFKYNIVCNYYPAGNYIGQKPYVAATATTATPTTAAPVPTTAAPTTKAPTTAPTTAAPVPGTTKAPSNTTTTSPGPTSGPSNTTTTTTTAPGPAPGPGPAAPTTLQPTIIAPTKSIVVNDTQNSTAVATGAASAALVFFTLLLL